MIVYTKEYGNKDPYSIDRDKKSVKFPKGEHFVSASLAIFTETDEKQVLNSYNDFKRIYNSELNRLYRQGDFKAVRYFIRKVLNNRNFVLTLCGKSFILAKILYYVLMTKQGYLSRPGYSLSFISDIAKLKDDLTYPMLITARNPDQNNFKQLLKVVINAPYHLSDFHNILKKDTTHIYWTDNYESWIQEFTKYNLDNEEMCDHYLTGFCFANVVERFTTGLKNETKSQIKFFRDVEHRIPYKVGLELGFSARDIHYVEKKKEPFLILLEDVSKFFYMLISDCMYIYDNNKSYDNEMFNLLSYVITKVNQENFEFQIPTSTWSAIVGITDLCNDSVSSFFKSNRIVDDIIRLQYLRVNDYLRNHFDDKRAFSVFKNRV